VSYWHVALKNGAVDCLYCDQVVLKGLRLEGSARDLNVEFSLEPFGEPYEVSTGAGTWRIHILRLKPVGEGPTDVLLEVHCGSKRISFRLYPRKPFTFRIRGKVYWGKEPYLCRIEPRRYENVVQAALGPADSLLCDSIFDKWNDRVLRLSSWGSLRIRSLIDGKSFEVEAEIKTQFGVIPEIIAGEVIEHYVAEHLGMPYYKPYDLSCHPRPPAGWCSWYYFGKEVTEEAVVANTDWLAEHLKSFGLEYVQLDDGYQGETWLNWDKKKFPRGGKWLAQYIRSKGLKPGIWLLPQAVGKVDTKLLEEKPDWFIRKPDGEVFRGFANYPYVDPTNPEVKSEWIEKTMRVMAHEWGIEYFKLDGQGEMHQWYALCRKSLHDYSPTPDEVYRRLLETIRRVVGPKRVILICATQWRAMGYGDTCRTGTDVSPAKLKEGAVCFLNALRATFSNYWMHTIVWYCDPDVIMVRPPLHYEAAKAWASLLGLSGQVLMVSDNMPELPPERVELLKRILPPQPIRPMDLFPRNPEGPYPQIWDLKVATKWGRWDVVGVFRWFKEYPAKVEITPEMLSLPPGRYIVYEVWEKKLLGELGEKLVVELKPESCKVFCIRPLERLPLFIGTNRHITQGYPDVVSLEWDKEGRTITGESLVVGGDPYEIRFLIDWNGEKYDCVEAVAQGAEIEQRVDGKLLVVTLRRSTSGKVKWHVEFEQK